jgi:hypothetical protein
MSRCAMLLTPDVSPALASYKASGELKKIQVSLIVNDGQIEFLTPGNSYKVKRARRNPRGTCYVGSEDGPAISGTAQIITDRSEVARVYRGLAQPILLPHPFPHIQCSKMDCNRISGPKLSRNEAPPLGQRALLAAQERSSPREQRQSAEAVPTKRPKDRNRSAQKGFS